MIELLENLFRRRRFNREPETGALVVSLVVPPYTYFSTKEKRIASDAKIYTRKFRTKRESYFLPDD